MNTDTEQQELVEIEVPISFVVRVSVDPADPHWRDALAASARDEVWTIIHALEGPMPLAAD